MKRIQCGAPAVPGGPLAFHGLYNVGDEVCFDLKFPGQRMVRLATVTATSEFFVHYDHERQGLRIEHAGAEVAFRRLSKKELGMSKKSKLIVRVFDAEEREK